MKKKIVFILLIGMIVFIGNNEVYASSGALKSVSIVKCNGVYYGKHGDGHYHKAVKRGDRWYPDGDAYYSSNPCNITTTKKTTKKSTTKKVVSTTKKKTTKKITTTTRIPKTTSTTTIEPITTTITTAEKMVNAEITTEKVNEEVDSESDDSILGFLGLWLTSGFGVVGYNFYKEKRK